MKLCFQSIWAVSVLCQVSVSCECVCLFLCRASGFWDRWYVKPAVQNRTHTSKCVCKNVYKLPYMGTASRNPAVSVMLSYQSVKLASKVYKMEVVCIGDKHSVIVCVNFSAFSSD